MIVLATQRDELLHALGALPAGAPHPCSASDDGHPCDSEQDILYPYASGAALSSLILDNTKTGWGRAGQEAAGFLANPVRGFNRILSGDVSEVKGNPIHSYDWRPTLQLFVRGGGRVIGEGESISENTNTYGFLEWALSYGDAWDPDNRRLYDRFDVVA